MSRVFFTDRDLGNRFPDILAASGIAVERHAAHFPPDCPDEEWLQQVGERGWVAVTHDSRIRYKLNERDAVIRHRVTLLVVVGKATNAVLAESFVAALPRISSFLERHDPPLIAKVHQQQPHGGRGRPTRGSISLWYPPTR